MPVSTNRTLTAAILVTLSVTMLACSDTTKEEKGTSISESQQQVDRAITGAIKAPIQQASEARKVLEERSRAALEGC